ncbi:MAG: hypothetical protein QG670_2551 [Thermoproteota archaeon]|nr:hypothetical protein [Thermoproteota archaeon]
MIEKLKAIIKKIVELLTRYPDGYAFIDTFGCYFYEFYSSHISKDDDEREDAVICTELP